MAVASAGDLAAQSAEPYDSTFNALDYVLQRPAPARKFETKKFGDRLFLSVEGGPSWMRKRDGIIGGSNLGYRAGVTVGDWVTPVHGWRIGLSAGRHYGEGEYKPFFGALSADWLINLSSLLRDDNPERPFELIGAIGAEVQGLHRSGHKLWGAAGVRLALQPRVYLTQSTYLYIEPRLGLYTDGLDDHKSWHRYDWDAQIMIGLGYRLNQGIGRRMVDNSLFVNDMFRNNLFCGFSGGLAILGTNTDNIKDRLSPQVSVFAGKWFTPVSALRVQLGGGALRELNQKRRWDGMVDIDYLFNLNSVMNGYDPDRRVEANIVLGASATYVSGQHKHIFPGLHAGFQGVLNASQNVGLYLEPQVRVFNHGVSHNTSRSFALMPSVNLGLIYRTRGSKEGNRMFSVLEDSTYETARHGFLTFEAGTFQRGRGWVKSAAASFMFGSWFSPVSAWRLGADAEVYNTHKPYRSLFATADYMASLSSLAVGFDPDRVFDLRAFVGLTGGAAYYKGGIHRFVWGGRAGLQAAFRLSDALDLVIEPQGQVLHIPKYTRKYNPEWRVMAGLTYKMESRRSLRNSSVLVTDASEIYPYFASLSVAPGLFTEGLARDKITWSFDGAVGKWFNGTSGAQLYLDYNLAKTKRKDLNIGTLGVDYMLNISSLMLGAPSRKFNLIGLGGVGVAWSDDKGSSAAAAFKLGLQGRWYLSRRFELTLSPSVTGWTRGIMGNAPHNLMANGSLAVGGSYGF